MRVHGIVPADMALDPTHRLDDADASSRERSVDSGVLAVLPAHRGHFRLESGHHGDLWLDVELMFLNPAPVQRLAERLAKALSSYGVEAVCGPLVEGAFVALTVAATLDVPFTYSERREDRTKAGLFPVAYTVPGALRR